MRAIPEFSSPRALRLAVAVLVAALHLAAVLVLIRAFAPAFTQRMTEGVVAAFTVTVTTPPPPQPKSVPPTALPDPAGAAGEAGRKAVPKAAAPKPRIVLASSPAPSVSGTGSAVTAGARATGTGTGAGGEGSGTGLGTGGDGQGGGGSSKAVKLAGDINSTRDYPQASREARRGDYVIVALTVGSDGRVKACRIHRPSRDAEADRITCALATERFRFRPATDAAGAPIQSIYGWQQRWYAPDEKK